MNGIVEGERETLRPEQYDSALSPQSDDTFILHQQQDAAGNLCFSRQLIKSYAYGISPHALCSLSLVSLYANTILL